MDACVKLTFVTLCFELPGAVTKYGLACAYFSDWSKWMYLINSGPHVLFQPTVAVMGAETQFVHAHTWPYEKNIASNPNHGKV